MTKCEYISISEVKCLKAMLVLGWVTALLKLVKRIKNLFQNIKRIKKHPGMVYYPPDKKPAISGLFG